MSQRLQIKNLGPKTIQVYGGGSIQDVSHGESGTVFVQGGWPDD